MIDLGDPKTRIYEPTAEDLAILAEWLESRPECVRALAVRFNPWTLYRMKSTGHRVTVASFGEDGTMSVDVTGEFNLVLHERRVFGIDPDDLEPCPLPEPGEPLGATLSQQEVADNLDAVRVMVRPDLWEMGADGVARRKT